MTNTKVHTIQHSYKIQGTGKNKKLFIRERNFDKHSSAIKKLEFLWE